MDEKPSISKNSLFNIFKNNNEAVLRSPTPSHLLNRSGNSAFKVPPFGSTPVNYNNIPLQLGNEHLLLSQQFHHTSANDYDLEENFPSFPSSVITTPTILSNLSPSSIYSPHSQNLGHGLEATIIPGNSLQNPLSFSSFQPITGTFLGNSHGKMENQQKHPIRPLPVRGVSPQLHYTFSKDSNIVLSLNDNDNDSINNDSIRNIDSISLVKDDNNSTRQDEEIKMVSFDNEDLESIISYQYDFEMLDKSKQVIQVNQSNQIEQASEDDKCLELIKWHLKIISIKDIPVSEIPEGIIPEGTDFWMILSGIINGTRDKWHSGAVIARENNRRVQTAKDKSYVLIGKLSAKKMKADGFSEGLIKAFEDGFPENWRELLLADLKSLNDEISFSFKESHVLNLCEESSSCEKHINSEEESTPQKDNSSTCEEQNEIISLEENVSPVETPELQGSSKRRFKTPDQKQGVVTSSGRLIRAPGNWWEVNPVNPEPNVKEEPKRRRSSKRVIPLTKKQPATGKYTQPSKTEAKKRNRKQLYRGTRKRRAPRKDNATGNMSEAFHEERTGKVNTEKITADMPRHEVYVLVETGKPK
ncbi:hypothetical protein RclHR1_03750005 [Rhizophagus clarus]|uniref:Mis18-binding protein 1 n=1 Tax=Rhizophagus clarus TaxID=94130 RepID=A0A2Z6RC91_9GLOM|nr:hypothetical protein RclHR1_03750005 [Rhizophagus clarus]GET02473.1 mis18-binding protein 1 [Rhizophagus clarus]